MDQDFTDITNSQIALIVSIALIGAALGAFVSGYISDLHGRKKVIIVADILFTVGALVMALAPSIGMIMLGRFISGVGIGSASLIVPLYLSEVAPIEIRGRLITMNIAMITIGQVLSTLTAIALSPNWRLMLGLSGVPSLL